MLCAGTPLPDAPRANRLAGITTQSVGARRPSTPSRNERRDTTPRQAMESSTVGSPRRPRSPDRRAEPAPTGWAWRRAPGTISAPSAQPGSPGGAGSNRLGRGAFVPPCWRGLCPPIFAVAARTRWDRGRNELRKLTASAPRNGTKHRARAERGNEDSTWCSKKSPIRSSSTCIGGVRNDEREPLDHDRCGAALTHRLRHLCATLCVTPQLDSQQ